MNRALLPAWQLPEPDMLISKEVAGPQKPYECPTLLKILTLSSSTYSTATRTFAADSNNIIDNNYIIIDNINID